MKNIYPSFSAPIGYSMQSRGSTVKTFIYEAFTPSSHKILMWKVVFSSYIIKAMWKVVISQGQMCHKEYLISQVIWHQAWPNITNATITIYTQPMTLSIYVKSCIPSTWAVHLTFLQWQFYLAYRKEFQPLNHLIIISNMIITKIMRSHYTWWSRLEMDIWNDLEFLCSRIPKYTYWALTHILFERDKESHWH